MSFKDDYRRERKRIQRYISYRKGLGFLSDFKLPKIPKRITEGSVRRLQKITPKILKEKETTYVSRETGKITVSSDHFKLTKEYKREKKEKNARKKSVVKTPPSRSQIVIRNFMEDASNFPNSAYPIIQKFLDELRKSYTEDEIAGMLEESAQAGKRLTYEVAYNPELLIGWLGDTFPGNARLMDDMEDFVFENDFYEYEYG